MRDPTHYPLSDTLVGIRLRAGYTVWALAEYLELDAERIALFETGHSVDPELMERYGELARRRTP